MGANRYHLGHMGTNVCHRQGGVLHLGLETSHGTEVAKAGAGMLAESGATVLAKVEAQAGQAARIERAKAAARNGVEVQPGVQLLLQRLLVVQPRHLAVQQVLRSADRCISARAHFAINFRGPLTSNVHHLMGSTCMCPGAAMQERHPITDAFATG